MKRPPRACARSGISGLKDQRIPGDDSVAKPKRNAIPRLESITRGEGRGKREREGDPSARRQERIRE